MELLQPGRKNLSEVCAALTVALRDEHSDCHIPISKAPSGPCRESPPYGKVLTRTVTCFSIGDKTFPQGGYAMGKARKKKKSAALPRRMHISGNVQVGKARKRKKA